VHVREPIARRPSVWTPKASTRALVRTRALSRAFRWVASSHEYGHWASIGRWRNAVTGVSRDLHKRETCAEEIPVI